MRAWLLAAILPCASLALDTATCPSQMTITYESYVAFDSEETENEIDNLNARPNMGRVQEVQYALKNTRPAKRNFQLAGMMKTACWYTEGEASGGRIRAEIFMRDWDQRSVLKIVHSFGGELLNTYHPLKNVSPFGIKVARNGSYSKVFLPLQKGRELPLGWAEAVTVAVNGFVWRTIDEKIYLCRNAKGSLEMRGVGAPQIKLEFNRDRRDQFLVDRSIKGSCADRGDSLCYTNGRIMVNVPSQGPILVNRSAEALRPGAPLGEPYDCTHYNP